MRNKELESQLVESDNQLQAVSSECNELKMKVKKQFIVAWVSFCVEFTITSICVISLCKAATLKYCSQLLLIQHHLCRISEALGLTFISMCCASITFPDNCYDATPELIVMNFLLLYYINVIFIKCKIKYYFILQSAINTTTWNIL